MEKMKQTRETKRKTRKRNTIKAETEIIKLQLLNILETWTLH